MNQKTARTAGLLYLVHAAAGIVSLVYVPSQIIVRGDAAATVSNILAFEPLFRFGIVAGLICYTTFVLLPLVLYKLLSPVASGAAVLMVAFAVVSVPIAFVNELNQLHVLSLVSGAGYLQAFTTEQLQAEAMLSLAAYGKGILVLKIFWGLWLLPFGYLVFKSGYLPRVLGILLILGCFGYLIDFFGGALFPGYPATVFPDFVRTPASLGEIGTCLWLLIVGIREPKSPVASTPGAV
ncbi:MAG: DUF4386 domain-containing protein [Steroidobacteraceae bacterium]